VLQHQPAYLDILPLYMVLLGWFWVLMALARVHAVLALAASAALWAIAHFKGLNLPSYPESFGWYFNPLAWQLLFTIGVLAGLAHRSGAAVPRSRWLCVAAIAYLLFAFLLVAPWTQIPAWQDHELLPRDLIGSISKRNLSPWRLANILALAYLIAIAVPASASWLRHRCLRWVINLGRNALEVFCAGTVSSLMGFVVLVDVDRGMATQLAVNFGGLLAMGVTAWWAGKRKQRHRTAATQHAVVIDRARGRRTLYQLRARASSRQSLPYRSSSRRHSLPYCWSRR
jgi:hypothetical protein